MQPSAGGEGEGEGGEGITHPTARRLSSSAFRRPPISSSSSSLPKTIPDETPAAAFLARHGLSRYTGALEEIGADTVGDLREAEEEDLVEAGMKKLHARRLLKLLIG